MTNLIDRAATRLAEWRIARKARAAHGAALYGDRDPGHHLINWTLHHRHHQRRLAIVAGVWADAYLAATPSADVVLLTPIDRWLGEVIADRADRSNPELFAKTIAEIPEREVEYRLTALLRMAANAQLELDDPDPVWP